MNIKDLLNCVPGTEVVGFPLCIKTARKTFQDADGKQWQEVVFIDSSGEIEGMIYLPPMDEESSFGEKRVGKSHVWKSKDAICVMRGEIQESDTRKKQSNKLVVFECFNAVTPLSFDQQQSWMSQEAEEHYEFRKKEIRDKVRHWVSCSHIEGYSENTGQMPTLTVPKKQAINTWVDYIMTGK